MIYESLLNIKKNMNKVEKECLLDCHKMTKSIFHRLNYIYYFVTIYIINTN